uniref:ATP synthase F0 subunit 8 n=1 Tax=Enoplolambrus validus TaxID=2969665 RepID=UPI0023F3269E|nr:ATP synthase F0 subunit 8 [Enoplolambrus validus]WDV10164.1 ATP synthase F0 subunit 8 [Enoplolambrus validus]
MPQMAPMMWLSLFFFFFLMMLFFMVLNFYIKPYKNMLNSKKHHTQIFKSWNYS